MPDWLPFLALGLATFALFNSLRSRLSARRNSPDAGESFPVKVVATRGRTLAGSYIVVIELASDDVAASPDLFAALMSAPPDGPAVPDHTVPLWHRNGGYEA